MSRLERKSKEKVKRKKYKTMTRLIFSLVMVLNLIICIYLVEKSANEYLGKETTINFSIKETYIKVQKNIKEFINAIKNTNF